MQKVLDKITPTPMERKKFNNCVASFLKKLKVKDAKVILGGSGAKNTWLSGSHDIDFFVQFDKTDENISDILEKSIKKSFPKKKLSRIHGSRDYFQITYGGFVVEVIPIIKITKASNALNITDISALHEKWVNKNVKDKKQVLLIKQFCKAQNMYGAESYLSGFSGYVLEILIGFYGTFENLLKASIKWKLKTIIDPEKYYKKRMALFHLNSSKQISPLIVIDPVDKNRNAAAALSEEKFQYFRKKAKEYLKNASEKFFVKEEIDVEKLSKLGNLVVINLSPVSGKRDVVGAKLLKVFNFIKKELLPFGIRKALWDWDTIYIVVKLKELPPFEIRTGPPVKMKEHVKDFKKKNKQTFIKNKQIYAKVRMKHPKLNDFVKNKLEDKYLKDKYKRVKSLV